MSIAHPCVSNKSERLLNIKYFYDSCYTLDLNAYLKANAYIILLKTIEQIKQTLKYHSNVNFFIYYRYINKY